MTAVLAAWSLRWRCTIASFLQFSMVAVYGLLEPSITRAVQMKHASIGPDDANDGELSAMLLSVATER